jgi:hypothetical protein
VRGQARRRRGARRGRRRQRSFAWRNNVRPSAPDEFFLVGGAGGQADCDDDFDGVIHASPAIPLNRCDQVWVCVSFHGVCADAGAAGGGCWVMHGVGQNKVCQGGDGHFPGLFQPLCKRYGGGPKVVLRDGRQLGTRRHGGRRCCRGIMPRGRGDDASGIRRHHSSRAPRIAEKMRASAASLRWLFARFCCKHKWNWLPDLFLVHPPTLPRRDFFGSSRRATKETKQIRKRAPSAVQSLGRAGDLIFWPPVLAGRQCWTVFSANKNHNYTIEI